MPYSGADAIVAFAVDERLIDDLIELLDGGGDRRLRWFVFGHDMNLLGALVLQWGLAADLTVCHVPSSSEAVREGVQQILECEGIDPGRCVWVDSTIPGDTPCGILLPAHHQSPDALAAEVERILPARGTRYFRE
jgi:hypothetical protein